MAPDDPTQELPSKLDPSDPLALNALSSPRTLKVPRDQAFKVDISVAIKKINYSDTSVVQETKQVASITLKVRKGFHQEKKFYEDSLRIAQSILRSKPLFTVHQEKGFQMSFENPIITYQVVQDRTVVLHWVKFPLTDSVHLLTAPSIIDLPNHAAHAQFFIDFDLAVNGPQWTPTMPVVTVPPAPERVPTPPPPPATTEPSRPEWPIGTDRMVEQMVDLAQKYVIFSPTLVMNKLARIFHTYRHTADPEFLRYKQNMPLPDSSADPVSKPSVEIQKNVTPPMEPLWQFDKTEDAHSETKSAVASTSNNLQSDRSVDARKILEWRNDVRGGRDRGRERSGDRESERSRGYERHVDRGDRRYDRSSSRGRDRSYSDARRDDGFDFNKQRGQRRRAAYRQ